MLIHRLAELVRKDLKLYARDRQALVLSLAVPALIAGILGWMDVTSASDKPTEAVQVDVADLDQSPASRAVVAKLRESTSVRAVPASADQASTDVASGAVVAAAIVPKGFGALSDSPGPNAAKPEIRLQTDPARPLESQVVKGAVMEAASKAVAEVGLGALADLSVVPVEVRTENVAASQAARSWASAAHDFAGFGMQGLLFFAMEAAVGLTRERRQGIWQRYRSAPMPLALILVARLISSTAVAFAIVLAMFGLGAVLFGIRILGSPLGFLTIAAATALVAASFGILLVTLCRTEAQSRGVAFLLIMVMLATGGAWFPMSTMPCFV